MTESYVSQPLSRRKAPPGAGAYEIYEKMERFLKLPAGDLSRIADVQRKQELKRALVEFLKGLKIQDDATDCAVLLSGVIEPGDPLHFGADGSE